MLDDAYIARAPHRWISINLFVILVLCISFSKYSPLIKDHIIQDFEDGKHIQLLLESNGLFYNYLKRPKQISSQDNSRSSPGMVRKCLETKSEYCFLNAIAQA